MSSKIRILQILMIFQPKF